MEGAELKGTKRNKKTKTLYIRRAPNEEKKNKKQLMVSRKPRPGEDISQVSEVGSSVGVKGVRRDEAGRPLERSILGSVENFQEVEAVETPDEFMEIAAASSGGGGEPLSPMVSIQEHGNNNNKNNHHGGGGTSVNASSSSSHHSHNNNDPSIIFHAYLHRLQASIKGSIEKMEEESRNKQLMINSLLPSEKFNKLRDGKVMARWEERQKEWERLQNTIARKMGKDPKKMLMGESNDFRERLEEYQTVLASVPLHERNIGALWEMSLRDGATRHAPIGNIFSGLFCPLKVEIPLPKVVRKPNLAILPPLPPTSSSSSDMMNKTMNNSMDENAAWRKDHALSHRKKTLKKRLAEMRPHEIAMNDVNNLVVYGYDLLQWAHDSSKQVYEEKKKNNKKLLNQQNQQNGGEEKGDNFNQTRAVFEDELDDAEKARRALLDVDDDGFISKDGTESASRGQGPQLHVGPSPYVLLEAAVKEPAESALTLYNSGSVTLFFEWTRSEEEVPSLVTVSKRATAEGHVPSDPSALFAISKDASESRFLCQNASGVLMPGQTKATVFAFESSTPGSFSETWKLKVTPPAQVFGELLPKVKMPPKTNDNNNGQKNDDFQTDDEDDDAANGLVAVSLLGACLASDTNEHRRLPIRLGIEKKVTCAEMKDLVTSVVRDVKTPRREETIRAAQKKNFERLNIKIGGLNYTAPIYDAFAALWVKVNDWAPPDPDREDDEPLPEWDGDVSSIRAVIDRMYDDDSPRNKQGGQGGAYGGVHYEALNDGGGGKANILNLADGSYTSEEASEFDEGSEVQVSLASKEEKEDKEGGGGEGDEDEEEDDEDVSFSLPNDDDEDEFSIVYNDNEDEWSPLKKARNEVDMELKLLIARATARPLPTLATIFKEKISSQLASLVVDAVEETRNKLKINKNVKYAPLPSPYKQFYTPCDAVLPDIEKIWNDALVGQGDPTVDKQTSEYYYRSKVHSTLNESLSTLIDSFSGIASNIHKETLTKFNSHGSVSGFSSDGGGGSGSVSSTGKDHQEQEEDRDKLVHHGLNKISTIRFDSDIEHNKILLLLDLDVGSEMIPDAYGGEEFILPPAPKPYKIIKAVKFIRKILKHNPSRILITSELTSTPETEKHLSPELGTMSLKSLEPMLSAMLKMPVVFCESIEALTNLLQVPAALKNSNDFAAIKDHAANMIKNKIILLDHVDADTMIPLPEPEVEVIPDEEEEVIPWLGDEKQDPSLLPKPPPQPLDLGLALRPFVDVFVYDTVSDSCLDENRCMSKLGPFPRISSPSSSESVSSASLTAASSSSSAVASPAPSVSDQGVLRVTGPNLHREIITVDVLASRPKHPILAIVAGDDLMEEVKHIDRMIDMVDELVIAGNIGLVFLAALGHKTGAMQHDPAYMPMARALLSKAQMMGVPVTLPVDFVMGDVYVDANSGATMATSFGGDGEDEDDEDEPPLESNGFDYDGETLECTVSEGLMKRMHALDLGNQSINLFKELVERCNTILWTGLVGVAQCSAFQQGSRELVESVISAHEDKGALVVLGGEELNKWANLFHHSEDYVMLGDGNGITHSFKNIHVAKRLLSMVPIPCVDIMTTREPNEEELMLEEEIRAKKIMDGLVDSDDEDDDEDELESAGGGEEADY
jgi:3-phosphoglycerate kinase